MKERVLQDQWKYLQVAPTIYQTVKGLLVDIDYKVVPTKILNKFARDNIDKQLIACGWIIQFTTKRWQHNSNIISYIYLSEKHLNKILKNNQPITLEIARLLSEVFNTSARYWINIDTGYRLWLEQERSEKEIAVELKATIYERKPVNDMIKKGWLNPFDDLDSLKNQVLEFWGWKKPDFSV